VWNPGCHQNMFCSRTLTGPHLASSYRKHNDKLPEQAMACVIVLYKSNRNDAHEILVPGRACY
jgi:hypothetical protein